MTNLPISIDTPIPPASFLTRLAAGVLLVNLFVLILAGLSLRQSYHQYQEQAEITTRNLAQVLDQYLVGVVGKIDLALLGAAGEAERQIAAGGIGAQALTAFLTRQQENLPELDSLRMCDERGIVRYGAGVPPGSQVNIADREHFIRLRDHPEAGLVITAPIFARINRKWVLPIARRVNRPDGAFAGMVYAFIPLEYLARTFSSLEVGSGGIVTLRDGDLGILIRHPEPQDIGSVVGQRAAPAPLRAMLQDGKKSGTYTALSTVDGAERTFSFRRVGGHPFLIIVGLASADYLDEWRSQAAKAGALAALFFLVTLLSSRLLYLGWKHQIAAAAALRAQKDFLDTILETEPECVKIITPNGKLVQMNQAGLAMLEIDSIQEAEEAGLLGFILPQHRADFVALSRRVFGGESGTLEFLVEGRKGTRRWLDTHAAPLRNAQGKVTALVAVTRDITKRKQSEAQLRELNETLEQRVAETVQKNMEQERMLIQQSRLAAMGEMIGNIAHQWRQPLNALAVLQANIKDAFEFGELTREVMNKFTEDGQRFIQKMSATIDDFRDFFKPNREKTEFPLHQAIEHALKIVNASFHDRHIAVNCATGADIRVTGYPNELSQVLLNALNNAKEAILERNVQDGKIDVSLDQGEEKAWITIRDNGGGIPQDILPKIFDPYFTTKAKGTGIGLYMSKMIMEHMGGTIEASNIEGGAELRIVLPKPALPNVNPSAL